MTTTTTSTYRLLGHPAACPSWCTNGDLPNHSARLVLDRRDRGA